VNIGILTSTDPKLRQQLAASLSPDAEAAPVENQAPAEVAVAKQRPTVNTAPSVKFPSLRAALDARIAADVSWGQLSAADATAVGTVLDAIDSRSGASAGPTSTAAFLAGRAVSPSGIDGSAVTVARDYLATIDRGTLIDRWA
jgi:hypothetical protein